MKKSSFFKLHSILIIACTILFSMLLVFSFAPFSQIESKNNKKESFVSGESQQTGNYTVVDKTKELIDFYTKDIDFDAIKSEEQILPEGYTQIQYIETNGLQWLETNINPANHMIKADFQFLSENQNQYLFGLEGTQSYFFAIGNSVWKYGCGTKIKTFEGCGLLERQTLIFNDENGNILQNGNIVGTCDNDVASYSYKVQLFSKNTGWSYHQDSHNASVRLYSFQIINKSTGEIVRDYVPYYYNYNKEFGLYERITDAFIAGGDGVNMSWHTAGYCAAPYKIYDNFDFKTYYMEKNLLESGDTLGTKDDPYVLTTREDLYMFTTSLQLRRQFTTKTFFALGNDIQMNDGYFDENGEYVDGGDGILYTWVPLGDKATFNGYLDGRGFKITGLYIDENEFSNVGFIGNAISKGNEDYNIKNLTIENSYISGEATNIGGFVGKTQQDYGVTSFSMKACSFNGQISTKGDCIGGLMGSGLKTTLEDCCFKGKLSATGKRVCGVVGQADLLKSYGVSFDGKLQAEAENIYGLVYSTNVNATLSDSLCKGEITGNITKEKGAISGIGNIVLNSCTNYANIYSTGEIENSVIGLGANGSYDCVNKGFLQCVNGKTYGISIWGAVENCVNFADGIDYGIGAATEARNCENYGDCTYAMFASTYRLVQDCINRGDNGQCGITLDLTANGSKAINCINYGDINKDLNNWNAGGIAMYSNYNCGVENCINYGTIYSKAANSAGIAAYLRSSSYINNCKNFGKVIAPEANEIGGVLGNGMSVTIKESSNFADVVGKNHVGGILGYLTYAGPIDNCKNFGVIKGYSQIGGIIGYLHSIGSKNMVSNCINYSKIEGSSDHIGGIAGMCGQIERAWKLVNKGEIISGNNAGGIFGYFADNRGKYFDSCINEGKVKGAKVASGMFTTGMAILKNCCNTGDLESLKPIYYSENTKVENFINCGKMNTKQGKYAEGYNFKAFYWSWKTGKIGLKAIDGNGLFQGDVNGEYLQKQGYEGVYMPEEPDPGSDLYSKYTQLEYIESTGTQYIDTGVQSKNGLGCDVEFSFSAQSQRDQYLLGEVIVNNSRFCPVFLDANQNISYCSTLEFVSVAYESLNDSKHIVNYNSDGKGQIKYDGILKGQVSDMGSGVGGNIYVFARNYNGMNMNSYAKIYSLKMYDNGTLVRSFIPAKRNTDGVVGLYDQVEGKFYENQGTGNFVAGSKKSNVPAGYQELESITIVNDSVNGYTNGINTGVSWSEINKIKITNSTPSAANAGRLMILKSDGSGSPWIGYGGNNQYVTFNGLTGTQTQEYKVEDYVGGDKKEILYEVTSTSPNKIIYGCWQDFYWSGTSTLYSMEMYKDETLVRSFVPAKRDSDGVVGLYDRVEGKFYTNQGTGSFVAGAEK